MHEHEPIDIYISGNAGDPREAADAPDGLTVRRGPPLHRDDTDVVNGIPVTSVSRTLIDLAEVISEDELRQAFRTAIAKGLVDFDKLAASRERVEWRPSLPMFDKVAAEFG